MPPGCLAKTRHRLFARIEESWLRAWRQKDGTSVAAAAQEEAKRKKAERHRADHRPRIFMDIGVGGFGRLAGAFRCTPLPLLGRFLEGPRFLLDFRADSLGSFLSV